MRITERDAKRFGLNLKTARGVVRQPGLNGTERAYAAHLEVGRMAGEVAWYAPHPVSLKLADKLWYRPDFLVMAQNLEIACVEVKGRSGGRWAAKSGLPFYTEEDSWAKIKVAASTYPFRFMVVWPGRDGGWESMEIGP